MDLREYDDETTRERESTKRSIDLIKDAHDRNMRELATQISLDGVLSLCPKQEEGWNRSETFEKGNWIRRYVLNERYRIGMSGDKLVIYDENERKEIREFNSDKVGERYNAIADKILKSK